MTYDELYNIRYREVRTRTYSMCEWSDFDYSILKCVLQIYKRSKHDDSRYNDVIIMVDTETSKQSKNVYTTIVKNGVEVQKVIPVTNYVVAWTISIRAFHTNIVTLYGHKPSELVACIKMIHEHMNGNKTVMYIHNLAYDWVFIRQFMFEKFGYPTKQINTKSHYPIMIEFEKGIVFKDSLILAQRKLEKWANDFNIEHKKAVGRWNYDKIRSQNERFTKDELLYIECDTLAGVECIDALMTQLGKDITTIPYTATGIPREQVRKLANANNYRDVFLKTAPTFEQYQKLLLIYHGGYTHGNRHYLNVNICDMLTMCYDFSSSYPFCMLAFKYPSERFTPIDNMTVDKILATSDTYAYIFKVTFTNIRLKDSTFGMPPLQFSKAVSYGDCIVDNGRVLACVGDYSIYLNEIDLEVIDKYYKYDEATITECEYSYKQYLPQWFTDYVYQCYVDKTKLKGGDPVLYSIKKSTVNSLYGMTCQKSVRDEWIENYINGKYSILNVDMEEEYNKYINRRSSVLQYYIGVWVTSYAFRNLFELGACFERWLYSDTDSCYGNNPNIDKINEYNNKCKQLLQANGYGAVLFNNREYWLGIAEHDGDNDTYSEYKYMGAKRYCGRNVADGELHITVAGVPKKGAKCLQNDIKNFMPDFVFKGEETGKLTHTYINVGKMCIDAHGNEIGDSIDLNPCDYLLACTDLVDFDELMYEDIDIQIYDEV